MSKCVIILSHSNYRKTFAGTEKFIAEIQKLYNDTGIHVLQAFPVKAINKYLKKYLGFKGNYLGMHLDGKYIGLYLQEKLPEALKYIQDKLKLEYIGVSINHLLLWNTDDLADSLLRIGLPINIIVHDYYMVCPYINNEGQSINENDKTIHVPDDVKCEGCIHLEKGKEYATTINSFFDKVDSLVERVIFPSESIKGAWCSIYERFNKRATIRPHLTYSSYKKNKSVGSVLKVAYLGNVIPIKGIEEWRMLTEKGKSDHVSYYYFGKMIDEQVGSVVDKVYVGMKDGRLIPMADELKRNKIDVAFLWSKCQETYCYTLFEAVEAGCFIVTLKGSGNIEDFVNENRCGKVFDDIESLIQSIHDDSFYDIVKTYYNDCFVIKDVSQNNELESLMFDTKKSIPDSIDSIGPSKLLSKVYEKAVVRY